MDKHVADMLRDQVNKEFYSAFLYLDISNYYYEKNLNGFGHWFMIQFQEEQDHALKIIKYLQDNEEPVKLDAIPAPDVKFTDLRQPLEETLKHEKYVTSLIHAIAKKARECDDFRTSQFLEWFIAEQGEEESNTSDLLNNFDLFGNDAKGLFLLNNELKSRVYNTGDSAN